VDDPGLLPAAPSVATVQATRAGTVTAIRAGAIGRASHALGAGRSVVGEAIDHAVGARLLVDRGDTVQAGDPLVELHHRDGRGLDAATALCGEAFVIADEGRATYDRIIGEVR
jgi:pyrimidine-nucleoside phosphorylase/thymidine phosphorylase